MVEKKDAEVVELLMVKSGTDYVRFTNNGSERCVMNKGSVFSLLEVDEVKKKCAALDDTFLDLKLVKLSIREELFTG